MPALPLVHQVGTFSSSVSVKVPSRSKTMASGGWPPSGNGASCGGVSVAVAVLDITGTQLCCPIGPADISELHHHFTSAESVNRYPAGLLSHLASGGSPAQGAKQYACRHTVLIVLRSFLGR